MMVTPDELKENASNLVAGMRHDAELNRQAILIAEDLYATRASLAEQRTLAIAVADRAEALARALVGRKVELRSLADEVRAAEKQHCERVTSLKLNHPTWLAKQGAVVVHLQNELALYKPLAGCVVNEALALGPPRPGLPEAAPGLVRSARRMRTRASTLR